MKKAPSDDDLAHEKRRELQAAAFDALRYVNGGRELHAALLALILPAGSERAQRAWTKETEGDPTAHTWCVHVGHLFGPARLPWFEQLLTRMRGQEAATRQRLLEAARRVMQARGAMRPVDRLHWLVMRHRLSGNVSGQAKGAAASDLSQLPGVTVQAIAHYAAFLSRLVPTEATEPAADAVPTDWYASVMAPWAERAELPVFQVPDSDTLVSALTELQDMAWMQRPILLRSWFDAAVAHSVYRRLGDGAADALRLSCTLLDCPMPPALARHFVECVKDGG